MRTPARTLTLAALSLLALTATTGCVFSVTAVPEESTSLTKRVEALEKRVETLETRSPRRR